MTKKALILDDEGKIVVGARFTFDNGNELEALLSALPSEMIDRYAVHGILQQLGDSYAGAAKKGWTAADIEARVTELWTAAKSGAFGTGRTSTGGKLLEAFIRWAVDLGKTAEEAREAFADLDEDQKKELRKAAPIKAKIAEIDAEAAERAAAQAEASDEDLTAKYF